MRFSEDTPAEQARVRASVVDWRQANPDGTVEGMLAAVGSRFHKDYGPLLRVAFFRIGEQQDRQGAGSSVSTDAGEPASARAAGSPLVNATAGVHGSPSGRGGTGGKVASVPPGPRRGRGAP